jgi:hypothetical protein
MTPARIGHRLAPMSIGAAATTMECVLLGRDGDLHEEEAAEEDAAADGR